MDITTRYVTNASGKGRILAKGKGRQRTIPYDHSVSVEANHGTAAGTLALVLGLSWQDDIIHSGDDSRGHIFRWRQ